MTAIKNVFLFALLFILSSSAFSTQSFSDTSNQIYVNPPANTTIINTAPLPTNNQKNAITKPLKKHKPIPHYTIEIKSPANGQTFQNNTTSIPVTVSVDPELDVDEGDKIVLFIDGMQFGEPLASTTINTHRLDRGQHSLQAKVLQKNGPGAESPIVTIFQHRSSALLRPAAWKPLNPFGINKA